MATLLEAAGSGFEHVVRCGVWITELSYVSGMNSVYETFFPDPKPASATVGAGLVLGKVEIDCIALVPCPAEIGIQPFAPPHPLPAGWLTAPSEYPPRTRTNPVTSS